MTWQRIYLWCCLVLLLLGMIAACGPLTPDGRTLTPTWQFSAPTLAPSPTVDLTFPTSFPPGYSVPGQTDPDVANLPWDADVPPVVVDGTDLGTLTVQLPLRDGTLLTGSLYDIPPVDLEQTSLQPRLPGVLLIGVPPETWGSLPEVLRQNSFTALTLEMGEHQSANDLIDVLGAFSVLSTVDPGTMIVVGAGAGADQALLGCAVDLICDAVVLINPQAPETLLNLLPDFTPRPLLLLYGPGASVMAVLDVWQQRAPESTSMMVNVAVGEGVDFLVTQPEYITQIVEWMVVRGN